jgi:hypothetical protein
MKRTAALRVTGEICFYYSILTLFPAFQRWQLPMAGFTLACLLVALIAVGLRSATLRLLLSLLPAICFLFAEMHWLLVFPALAWLYFMLYLTLGRFGIALHDYRLAFRWMLLLSAFVLAIQAINSMLFRGAPLSYDSLAYLALFVLLGVVALRCMQMGAPMDGRWHAANLLTVAAALFVAVSISLVLYQLYLRSVPLLVFLITPLKRFLAWLFSLIRFRTAPDAPMSTPPLATPTIVFHEQSPLIMDQEGLHVEEPERTAFEHLADQAFSIGAFILLAFLVFIVLWLIVKLVLRGKALAEEAVDYEQTEDFTPDRARRKKQSETVHGQAQAVRKLYREYLTYLKENGLQRTASDTSEEILSESKRISSASASAEEALRSIYLKARYSAEAVTEEDVAAARASLNEIRSRERS